MSWEGSTKSIKPHCLTTSELTRSERKYWGGHRPKASWTLAGVRHWPPPQAACTGALSQYRNFPSIWSHPTWCSSKVTRRRAWHLPLCFLPHGNEVFLSASSSPDDSPGGHSLSSQDLPPSPLPASGPPLDAFQDLPILCVLGSTELLAPLKVRPHHHQPRSPPLLTGWPCVTHPLRRRALLWAAAATHLQPIPGLSTCHPAFPWLGSVPLLVARCPDAPRPLYEASRDQQHLPA